MPHRGLFCRCDKAQDARQSTLKKKGETYDSHVLVDRRCHRWSALVLFAGASISACGSSSPGGSQLGQGPAGTYVGTVTATLGKARDGFAYGVITRTTQVTVTVR